MLFNQFLQLLSASEKMRPDGGFVGFEHLGNFPKTIAIHHVQVEGCSPGGRQLLHNSQNFIRRYSIHNLIVEGYFRHIVQSQIGRVFMVLAVIANGRVDHNSAQPRLEGQVCIVLMQVLKHFQKAFIEHFPGFFRRGRITKANAFGIPEKLFEQRPLSLRILHPAGFDDTEQVIVRE